MRHRLQALRLHLHWFSVAGLFKYFWRHVARRATRGGEHVKLLLIHDSRQPKICYQQICVIFWCSEEKVLWFQVSMYNSVVVEVGYSGQGSTNEVRGIAFKVATLPTNSIEELSSKCEVRNEVYYGSYGLSLHSCTLRDEATYDCSSFQNNPQG